MEFSTSLLSRFGLEQWVATHSSIVLHHKLIAYVCVLSG
jgi:hypothetical protein